jgi:hypothetical protein
MDCIDNIETIIWVDFMLVLKMIYWYYRKLINKQNKPMYRKYTIKMSKRIPLGAIHKQTSEYVYPKIANKLDEYICPDCNKDLILCKGKVRVPYFRHKVDSVNPCNHYDHPTESQIHKDAKALLKTLLDKKIPITLVRKCASCEKNEEYEIPETSETSIVQIEYRFEYNGPKIADIAYLDNGEIVCIFEICNTHRTCSENRPEPWFEIDAKTLIELANYIGVITLLRIPCIRSENCEECVNKQQLQILRYTDLDKYVRIKLGQTVFPTPVCKCSFRCNFCDECKYYENWKQYGHKRIDFDAQYDSEINNQIFDLFEEDFVDYSVVIHTAKGGVIAYIVSKKMYKKFDYWGIEYRYGGGKYKSNPGYFRNDCIHPYLKKIEIGCSLGTVEIIKQCIEYSEEREKYGICICGRDGVECPTNGRCRC